MDVNRILLAGGGKIQIPRATRVDFVPALRDPFAASVLKIYNGGVQILRVGVFQADVDGFRRVWRHQQEHRCAQQAEPELADTVFQKQHLY